MAMRSIAFVFSLLAACGGAAASAKSPAPPAIDCDAFARSVAQGTAVNGGHESDDQGPITQGARVEGDPQIPPSHPEWEQMAKSGVRRVYVVAKLCLDEDGRVAGLALERPSGLPAYDKKLCEHMVTWRYRPWLRAGKPIEVCTEINFNYDIIGWDKP